MVLDEDTLEAMLKRQRVAAPSETPQRVALTHRTEEFEVYERPADETPVAPAPEAAVVPDAFAHFDEDRFDAPGPEAEEAPAPVPEPVAAPMLETEPETPRRPAVWPPLTHRSHAPEPRRAEPDPVPAPAPLPEAAPVREPAAPEPTTPHRFAPAPTPSGHGDGPRVAIVQALFNQELTDMMAQLATAKATKLGATVTHHLTVPGVYDLPLMAQTMAERKDVDAVVVIGVVVSGETKHDELITHATAKSLQEVSLATRTPVALGITGPGMTWAQAEARVANGAHAMEAAVAQWQVLRTV